MGRAQHRNQEVEEHNRKDGQVHHNQDRRHTVIPSTGELVENFSVAEHGFEQPSKVSPKLSKPWKRTWSAIANPTITTKITAPSWKSVDVMRKTTCAAGRDKDVVVIQTNRRQIV